MTPEENTLVRLLSILIRKLDQYFKPRNNVPYVTGLRTLPSSTDFSNRNNFDEHLLYVSLGYRPASGYVINHGPGNIYLKISADGQSFTEEEISLSPDSVFEWGNENPPLKVATVWVRSDTSGTIYELVAG